MGNTSFPQETPEQAAEREIRLKLSKKYREALDIALQNTDVFKLYKACKEEHVSLYIEVSPEYK